MDPYAAIWEECLEPASLSDVGLRRGNNQDALSIVIAGSQEKWERRGHLFMVADGMGAHAAGELASKMAVDSVPLTYHKTVDMPPPEALRAAVQAANHQIHTRGMASDDFRGMGTTASVLAILPQGAVIAHVGDSRVYRHRGSRIEQLTFDHSLVWELKAAGQIPDNEFPSYIPKNIITRSLGPNPSVEVDLEGPYAVEPGDTFLLCSDGLSGQVNDDEIGKILGVLPPKDAVRVLVDLANLRGGPDNITVIAVRVKGPQTAKGTTPVEPQPKPVPVRRHIHPAVWAAIVLLGLAAGGLFLMDYAPAAFGCLLGLVLAGGIGLMQRFHVEPDARNFDARPLGRGPFTKTDAVPDRDFVARLTQVTRQLRDAASGSRWCIRWEAFQGHEANASNADRSGDYATAAREYCYAISAMMAELRSQGDRESEQASGDSASGGAR